MWREEARGLTLSSLKLGVSTQMGEEVTVEADWSAQIWRLL